MGQPQRAARLAQPLGEPDVRVDRPRVHEHAGVEQVGRVEEVLDRGEQVDDLRGVHPRQQRRAGPAVAVLAGQAAAVRRGEVRGRLDEGPEGGRSPAPVEGEVDAHVHAAVAEVAVGHPVEPRVPQQRVEPAQVGAQPVRGDRGVLPAGVRGPLQAARGKARAVLADPPQRGRLGRPRHQPYVDRAGVARHPVGRRTGLLDRRTGHLGEQPAGAAGQVRHRPPPGPDHVDDPGVEPLAGDQRVVQQRRHGIRGLEHVRVAEHRQRPGGCVLDEPDGGAGDDAEGALAADQEPVEAAAALRQQVLQGVAGDLAGEPAEAGADGGQVVGDQGVEPVVQRGPGAVEPAAVGGEHVERDRRCRRSGRSRAHASRRRCCRPSRRWCSGCGSRGRGRSAGRAALAAFWRVACTVPGCDGRGARLGVDRQHPVQVPRGVDHDAGAHGVAGDRRTGSAHGQRGPGVPGHRDGGGELVGVPRPGHDLWDDPVERGVGGVQRPGQRRVVDVADPGAAEGVRDVGAGGHHGRNTCRRASGVDTVSGKAGRVMAEV